MSRKRCACHSSDLYATLVECPQCHHWSLDRQGDWAACERRRCGYEALSFAAAVELKFGEQLGWDEI